MAVAPPPIPAIAAGTHVILREPRLGGLPATVDVCEPGALLVALAVTDSRVARLAGGQVSVEATTQRGIQRYNGTLELVPGRKELLRIILEGAGERIQRREWARVDTVVPVKVTALDSGVGGETHTHNVSGGGVLISDLWNLPLGTDVRVELFAEPGAEPIRALGRVLREVDAERKGIRFDDLSRQDEERLIRFVRDRERAALRMGQR
jgi:c-di-GMP-binding flagellar brake protein YcgR